MDPATPKQSAATRALSGAQDACAPSRIAPAPRPPRHVKEEGPLLRREEGRVAGGHAVRGRASAQAARQRRDLVGCVACRSVLCTHDTLDLRMVAVMERCSRQRLFAVRRTAACVGVAALLRSPRAAWRRAPRLRMHAACCCASARAAPRRVWGTPVEALVAAPPDVVVAAGPVGVVHSLWACREGSALLQLPASKSDQTMSIRAPSIAA